jgi:hypothetical protein
VFIVFSLVVGYVCTVRAPDERSSVFGVLVTLFLTAFGLMGLSNELFSAEVIELKGPTLNVSDKVFGFQRTRDSRLR